MEVIYDIMFFSLQICFVGKSDCYPLIKRIYVQLLKLLNFEGPSYGIYFMSLKIHPR